MNARLLAPLLLALLAGCSAPPAPPLAAVPAGLTPWNVPGAAGSAQPSLSVSPAGQVLLLWYDQQPGRRTLLQFNTFSPVDGAWDVDRTVAVGSSFVVNRHDVPKLIADARGVLWVQWLQKTNEDGSAYDIIVSNSRDGGQQWSPPARPHDDGKRAEHGFPVLWPQTDGIGIAWLDGRNTVDADGRTASGAMQLRAAQYDIALQRRGDVLLDDRTCACCALSAAQTDAGPILAYRDHAANDVRDIATVRWQGKGWSKPSLVHADGWATKACPVNGPAIAAQGKAVSVAWTSQAAGAPVVRVSESRDGGANFSAPLSIDAGKGVLGQVQVARDASGAWIGWLREDNGITQLWLARQRAGANAVSDKTKVAELPNGAAVMGIPQLAVLQGTAYLVWTTLGEGGRTELQGARYRPLQ